MKTKIKAKWIIKFPVGSKVLVKEGERVEENQVVVKVDYRKIESINLSNFVGKFSSTKIEQLNKRLKGVWVNSGELMCLSGGVFPRKICFPMSGNFLEIDEFGLLKIEIKEDEQRELIAPIESLVSKIETDKLVLEFKAQEFKGKGLVEGKSWGEGSLEIIDEARDLTSKLKNNIILTQNLTNNFLLKAEVVGVVGVVTNSEIKEEELITNLPLLQLSKEVWQELLRYQGTNKKMLVNSRLERLLLVLE
jgi:hypothetical protein